MQRSTTMQTPDYTAFEANMQRARQARRYEPVWDVLTIVLALVAAAFSVGGYFWEALK